MIILTNSNNEIISYSLLGDIDGGILIDETTMPKDFLNLFKPKYYLYHDDKIIKNLNYREEDENISYRDVEMEELKVRVDELENKVKELTQGTE
ncbi:DUF2977 domain-containing protein [Mammaliicoccus sciuri]|uniref:DUF2977 domain-containing protein n=1 Tax=Mammaliicoccus sciuri TaxID=1296 RepID=UPI0008783600|nr:DUF2977 domain-containing protein [Mammaliicoccus sciuri]